MSKFKVGDKVICVNDKGWTKGYVVNGEDLYSSK
jgi:hypothetical protein